MSSIPVATDIPEFDLDMLSIPDAAERLGEPVNKIRQLLRDGKLLAVRRDGVLLIPAMLISDNPEEGVVKGLAGTITLLSDAGFGIDEIFRWLFTEDASLPGRPVDALRSDRGREVKRRAQALAF